MHTSSTNCLLMAFLVSFLHMAITAMPALKRVHACRDPNQNRIKPAWGPERWVTVRGSAAGVDSARTLAHRTLRNIFTQQTKQTFSDCATRPQRARLALGRGGGGASSLRTMWPSCSSTVMPGRGGLGIAARISSESSYSTDEDAASLACGARVPFGRGVSGTGGGAAPPRAIMCGGGAKAGSSASS